MSSLWLARDAAGPKNWKSAPHRKVARSVSAPRAWLGVFTDDPANIGRWLPRPKTPFVPAPELSPLGKGATPAGTDSTEMCDSPPSEVLFDFKQPRMAGMALGITVF
jgi:hypothetical protein